MYKHRAMGMQINAIESPSKQSQAQDKCKDRKKQASNPVWCQNDQERKKSAYCAWATLSASQLMPSNVSLGTTFHNMLE